MGLLPTTTAVVRLCNNGGRVGEGGGYTDSGGGVGTAPDFASPANGVTMLPRDSQFSTTPFVFPLFTLGLSHAFSSSFIPFATFRGLPRLFSPNFPTSLRPVATTALFQSPYPRREAPLSRLCSPLHSQRVHALKQIPAR